MCSYVFLHKNVFLEVNMDSRTLQKRRRASWILNILSPQMHGSKAMLTCSDVFNCVYVCVKCCLVTANLLGAFLQELLFLHFCTVNLWQLQQGL